MTIRDLFQFIGGGNLSKVEKSSEEREDCLMLRLFLFVPFRNLNFYPMTPERPLKILTGHIIPIPDDRKKDTKPKKPKLPTPPDSPVQCTDWRANSFLSNKKFSNSKSVLRQPSPIKVASVVSYSNPLQSVCNTICYSSDDSGRGTGTGTASDVSDDSDQWRVPTGRSKRKYHGRQKLSNDTLASDGDELFEKEKQRNKIDILKAVKCNIAHKLSANDDEVVDIIISLGQYLTFHHIEKLHWFLLDVERITLLLHSLARRLDRIELNILTAGETELREMEKKEKKIVEQLEDANDINDKLKDKLDTILNTIEKYLGAKTKDNFVSLINIKTKLLITSKEIDHKIRLYQAQLKI